MNQCVLSTQLQRDPQAPRLARQLLASTLGANDATCCFPGADLVLSELVTNAVLHTVGDSIRVDIDLHEDGRLRLAVIDAEAEVIEARDPGPGELGGRGLRVVDQLASDWGVTIAGMTKAVWAELMAEQ